jgi:hypothetical protein
MQQNTEVLVLKQVVHMITTVPWRLEKYKHIINRVIYIFQAFKILNVVCRSQWPRGLRHELSSLARTLGSWVRIALEARMFVFILCFC